MQHRELYRSIVPEDAYIISFSDLLTCTTKSAAAKIATGIYYKIGNSFSSKGMQEGTKAHKIKELELSDDWVNELRLAYKMSDGYYLTGTMDRYDYKTKTVEDFKTTESKAITYLKTNQVETYAFLAMNNGLVVEAGRYSMMNTKGEILDTVSVDISEATAVLCYSTFILPRFNMIKNELERLKNQYV